MDTLTTDCIGERIYRPISSSQSTLQHTQTHNVDTYIRVEGWGRETRERGGGREGREGQKGGTRKNTKREEEKVKDRRKEREENRNDKPSSSSSA